MPSLPSSLALTVIADAALATAADERNNFTAIQTAVNALIAALSGGTAGQVLEAVNSTTVDWLGGSVQAYTPTWTSSGTQPALGNGTITGRYIQVGKLVYAEIKLTMGSTSTFGTGAYAFSTPTTMSTTLQAFLPSVATAFDNSAPANYPGMLALNGATTVIPETLASPMINWGPTVPITFAVSDTISIAFTYEAA